MSEMYDVAVIGSGPGGYVAAIRAAQLGANVACIEKDALGGTCLNRGCIPTKALLEASHVVAAVKHAPGIEFGEPKVDYGKMVENKDAIVGRLNKGVGGLFKKNKITHVAGIGKLVAADEIEVTSLVGETSAVKAKKIIIATGSEPLNIPVFAFDGEMILSSTDILNQKELPESLLVLGGGVIGCEFACFYAEMGVPVTIVEMMDRCLPLGDADVSKEITKALKKLKVKIHTGAKLEKLEKAGGKVVGTLSNGKTVETAKALISIGRKLNADGIGLEDVGVEIGEQKQIVINEHCQTSVPNIYAIGDVTGKLLLAHLASRMAIVAAEHAMGENAAIDYRVVPACVFTHPEAAEVGLTEAAATEQGIDAKAFVFPIQVLGRAQALGELGGFIKLVGDTKTGELIGAQIVCSRAGEMIAEMALAMKLEATVDEIAKTIHVHPTLSEGTMEAAEGWLGHGIHYNA